MGVTSSENVLGMIYFVCITVIQKNEVLQTDKMRNLGDWETVSFCMRVIQTEQTNAGT